MNNDLGLPPFYVEQKVVALSTCVDKFRINGNIYVVKSLMKCNHCSVWWIDIGERVNSLLKNKCSCCKNIIDAQKDNCYWHHSRHFAPLLENFTAITFKEVIEIEQPLISVQ